MCFVYVCVCACVCVKCWLVRLLSSFLDPHSPLLFYLTFSTPSPHHSVLVSYSLPPFSIPELQGSTRIRSI
jgi:hypothetical protein